MLSKYESVLAFLLSRVFKIFFLWGFWFLGLLFGVASVASDATEPEGYYTRREYNDAMTAHSALWLIVFALVLGITLLFMRITIVIYGILAFVLLVLWMIFLIIKIFKWKKEGLRIADELISHIVGVKLKMSGYCFPYDAYGLRVFYAAVFILFSINFLNVHFFLWNFCPALFSWPVRYLISALSFACLTALAFL